MLSSQSFHLTARYTMQLSGKPREQTPSSVLTYTWNVWHNVSPSFVEGLCGNLGHCWPASKTRTKKLATKNGARCSSSWQRKQRVMRLRSTMLRQAIDRK